MPATQPPKDDIIQKAKELKAQVAPELKQYPNVTGVGVGYKVVNGHLTPDISIRVYVSKKLPSEALAPQDLIPQSIKGIPTDVIEARFRIHEGVPLDTNARARRTLLLGGISIGNWSLGGSGTLGCSVFDRRSGEQMILSNWHVLCGQSDCVEGEMIVQPGRGGTDTGSSEDIVARLHRWVLTNEVDCAIACLSGHRFLLPDILGLGHLASVTGAASLGLHVRKSGRTSGITEGSITDISADVTVDYDGVPRDMHNQIIIEGNGPVSKRGDSGSIWIDDANRAVALNFAGSDVHAIANHIDAVAEALEISFGIGMTLQGFTAVFASEP